MRIKIVCWQTKCINVLFLKNLENHPRLEQRFNEILQIAENTSEARITADKAETKAIEEMKKLGQKVMQEWIENQHEKRVEIFEEETKTRKHIKNSTSKQNLEK